MIEMLKNVNLSTLKNEKSLDDLIIWCKKEGKKQGAVEVLEKWIKKLEEYNFSFVKEMKRELKELKEGVEK
jgi:predicted CopG family antitoxin